jgi:charged multivesicular body protein 4
MFRRLFGESKSKENRNDDQQHRDAIKTIHQLQQNEEMMDKKLDKFDQEINETQIKARQCLDKTNPDRLGAIRLIKRRKQLEQQREKLFQMKENIQFVNEQIQSSHFNRQMTESFNIGQQYLKRTQKSMPTKKIEQIIENISEQIQISNEINDLLAAPMDSNLTNDLEIENELNHLNKEIIKENMIKINLPNAHSDKIQIENDIDQLKHLTTG